MIGKDIKKDFPIFDRKINGKEIVYLDNAATSQKPKAVIEAIVDFYSNRNANIHRGIHTLSEEATQMYEEAREKVATFINANEPKEVIFTKGSTDSLNFVAFSFAPKVIEKGDIILVLDSEHHSNLVPWQILAEKTGAKIEYLETNEEGELTKKEITEKIVSGVKIVAVAHASNVLGTIFPIKEVSKIAHEIRAYVVVDGAQAIPHIEVNVQSLDCDFYAFSAHKMLGPTGVGVLWVNRNLLDKLDPNQYGGGMIDVVTYTKSTWASSPERFEAGTPNICDVVAFKSAIEYLENIGMDKIHAYETELNEFVLSELSKLSYVKVLGPKDPEKRTGLVSFEIEGVHSHDVASVLNEYGIAVRSGNHCAMPLHQKYKISSSTRASYYIYNTKEDLSKLIEGIKKAKEMLG